MAKRSNKKQWAVFEADVMDEGYCAIVRARTAYQAEETYRRERLRGDGGLTPLKAVRTSQLVAMRSALR